MRQDRKPEVRATEDRMARDWTIRVALRPLRNLLRLAAVTALAFLSAGCGSESSCPPGSGRIYGRFTAPGDTLPGVGEVDATRLESGFESDAPIDSTGSFSIPVISGSYRIFLTMAGHVFYIFGFLSDQSGITQERDHATIYRVPSGGAVRIDAALGLVRLTIHGWSHIAGQSEDVALARSDGTRWSIGPYGSIEGDSLVLPPTCVPAGRYRLGIDLRHLDQAYWYPGTYREADGTWIDVGSTAETRVAWTLSYPAILYGTFTGAWREVGESQMNLAVVDVAGGSTVAEAAVRDSTLSIMIPGPLQARLRIDWHDIHRWVGGDSEGEATVFDLRPGDPTRVDILDSGIAGTTGHPPPSVLTIHDSTGTMLTHVGVTGDQGAFSFLNLTPGRRYYIQLHGEAGRWASQWYGGGASFDSAAPIVIPHEGDLVRIYFNIP